MRTLALPEGLDGAVRRVLQAPPRRFFRDRVRGAVGVATRDGGHSAAIDHTQDCHATHLQPCIDHRHRVVIAPHAGGAYRVEDGAGNVPGQLGQFVVGLRTHTQLLVLA